VDAATLLKKIVYQVEQVSAELHESVRRVGHDEEFSHVFGSALDFLLQMFRVEFE